MRREPIETSELLTWMEDDWLGLWELADQGGINAGIPLDSVIEFVIKSVEPGLRAGAIRLGRVFHASSPGQFEEINLSLRETLDLIRQGVRKDMIDVDIDLWFDSVPATDRPARRPGVS